LPAEYLTYRTALVVYWLNILLMGLMLYFSWWYACRAGLIKEGTPTEVEAAVVHLQHVLEHRVHRARPAELRARAEDPFSVPPLIALCNEELRACALASTT
jgi:hypothetical protein